MSTGTMLLIVVGSVVQSWVIVLDAETQKRKVGRGVTS